ncbi:MAG: RNA 2',3'-cyclic phosphodiesterase [Candidatus Omnitrophica bacterium]|nr:RNA 2',3'-cyclic phosphodiesterase [Candidatus Omnitrophota bacterium]
MRAFLAVELPDNVREAVVAVQRALAGDGVKWVEPENLHVTMRFLGEITEVQRQAIESLLLKVAGSRAPIDAALSAVGTFPERGMPRVIWVGIGQGAEQLSRLAEEIERGLAALSISNEERRFVAHVTLGRVRSPTAGDVLRRRLTQIRWTPPAPFWIERVTLFQSTLGGAGPVYTALGRFPLTAA